MSKLSGKPNSLGKSRYKTRSSSSRVDAPASSMVTGVNAVSPAVDVDINAATVNDRQETGVVASSDRPLATKGGVVPSEPAGDGEQDKQWKLSHAPSPGSTAKPAVPAYASDAATAAQESASKVTTRRSRRTKKSRRAAGVGSAKPSLRQAPTASPTATESNAELRDNPEEVAVKIPEKSASADREAPDQRVSSKGAPLKGTPVEGMAAASPSPYSEMMSAEPKTAGANDDLDLKGIDSPRTAKRKSTVAELYASITRLEDIATGLAKSPQSMTIRQALAGTNGKIMVACAVAGGFALVLVAITVAVSKRSMSRPKAICLTEDCVRHAALLTKHLDRNRDPCEDFSAYVCSAWHSSSDHSEQVTSVMDSLRFSWYKHFRDTLLHGTVKVPAGNKPLAMYDMCSVGYQSGDSQLTPFLEFLKTYKLTWPEPPKKLHRPLALVVGLAYKWQLPFWISVNVLEPASSRNRRILVRPGLYVPIVRNQHRNAQHSYAKYWEQFLVHLYPDVATRPPMNVTDVENVRDVEGDIIETLYSVIISANIPQPALFRLGELSHYVPITLTSNWVESFQRGLYLDPRLTLQDYIVTNDLSLIKTVAHLLVKYNARQLNKHLIWLFVQYYAPFAGYEFLKIHYGSERKAAVYLPAYCAHRVEVSYKVLILALSFYSLFTMQDKITIDSGFDNLVATATKKVEGSEWMDSESKVRVARKLTAVKKALWPPEAFLDSNELDEIYSEFPGKAETFFEYWALASTAIITTNRTREYLEAFMLRWNNLPGYFGYDYVLNSVELAIAVATPPAYYRNGTKAMLYGGLLFLMATQLVRAIDTEGLKWAPNGSAVDFILSNSIAPEFQERASCIKSAENSTAFPEIPALDITYSAFKHSYLLEETAPLPLSEDLPADKVFFMTVCYLTCAKPSGQYPLAADCNKLVRNSNAFAQTFNCPKGSKMNPESKCSLFT